MRGADVRSVRLHEEMLTYNGSYMYEPWPSHFKFTIISLFVVRNIKCGYSFSKLERVAHFGTKIEQNRRIFLFCNKTPSSTATSFTMLI